MGNIGSQTGNITQRPSTIEEQWVHSFPRMQSRQERNKVLPDRDAHLKLRHTDNGDILKSGGTLSGRNVPNSQMECEEGIIRKSFFHLDDNAIDQRQRSEFNNKFYNKEKMRKFDSEPDLRTPDKNRRKQPPSQQRGRLLPKAKKKYKAPPPPSLARAKGAEKRDSEENSSSDTGGPTTERIRLYKTRAEMKRSNYSSPVHNYKQAGLGRRATGGPQGAPVQEKGAPLMSATRLSLPVVRIRSSVSDDFGKQLKDKLRAPKGDSAGGAEPPVSFNVTSKTGSKADKLKTLDHTFHHSRSSLQRKLCEMGAGEARGGGADAPRQPRTFYFGMEQDERDIVDYFTSNIRRPTNERVTKIVHSSESEVSSDLEPEGGREGARSGIRLQLRPILPKKQLDMPRFSPAAAWRLLASLDGSDPAASTIASDDAPVLVEERIEKLARPPPPHAQAGARSNNDKSGDSGISGDAGPAGYDDGPDVPAHTQPFAKMAPRLFKAQASSWTPQQDLGDDSSLEEGVGGENVCRRAQNSKPHVFSLSLPRENHLSSYLSDNHLSSYSSFQKLKRSFSGVLYNLSAKRELVQIGGSNVDEQNDNNWFLSKSAPNSLKNGFSSLELKQKNMFRENDCLAHVFKQSNGRLIYLPDECESKHQKQHQQSVARRGSGHVMRNREGGKERSRSVERSKFSHKLKEYPSTQESHVNCMRSSSEPEDLQDPPTTDAGVAGQWQYTKKPKRFTFQSTIRQIERRRLAEKLSREVEKKEKQRLIELEAMEKVEAEFQKKRAREKANIRQQLRLFSMDDASWSSLHPKLDAHDVKMLQTRSDPDGAVSSSTTSSPSMMQHKAQKHTKKGQAQGRRPSSESSDEASIKAQVTQVLSEFRCPQREYKEFARSARHLNDFHDTNAKQTTVYPEVKMNMPKTTSHHKNFSSGLNYRKDFAYSLKNTRSSGSAHSEDSQTKNHTSRNHKSSDKHDFYPLTHF